MLSGVASPAASQTAAAGPPGQAAGCNGQGLGFQPPGTVPARGAGARWAQAAAAGREGGGGGSGTGWRRAAAARGDERRRDPAIGLNPNPKS
jgi:hypothetical protein